MNDDIDLQDGTQLYDFSTKQKWNLDIPDKKCVVRRFQTTENWVKVPNTVAALCPGQLVIFNNGQQVKSLNSLSLEKHGGIKQMYVSGSEEPVYLIQFSDLSLHYFSQNFKFSWSREEALSSIQQLEIIHNPEDQMHVTYNFDYVSSWNSPSEGAGQRIVQRYVENLKHLSNYLFSTKMIDPSQRNQQLDIYGFRKVLVALTNFNKVIGFSSLDGSQLWSSLYYDVKPRQILLLKQHSRQEERTSTQVVVCFDDHVQFLSSQTGEVLGTKSFQRMVKAERFIVRNQESSQS